MKIVELYVTPKTLSGVFFSKYPSVLQFLGYKKLCSKAKSISKKIGEQQIEWYNLKNKKSVEKDFAVVSVRTYLFLKEETTYIEDFFENGKYVYSIKDSWFSGGKHTKEKFIK